MGLVTDTTETALVQRIQSVLLVHGPMSSSELRLRLRAERASVPGLASLVRAHSPSVFDVDQGVIRLADASAAAAGAEDRLADSSAAGAEDGAAAGLTRLNALELPRSLDAPVEGRLDAVGEVVVLDLDNRALLALERAVDRALVRDDVLLLACCSSAHNPRLPRRLAHDMEALAQRGALRLLTPQRDVSNGADFVCAFWVGFLHARLPAAASFVLISEDISLEQTVADALRGQGREVRSNPPELAPPRLR